ncbi:MAG: FkbM family methyltransferase [Planctomycetia bacterium]|nr:FkbM family methyltransferase [Planctomycetia bacterium]
MGEYSALTEFCATPVGWILDLGGNVGYSVRLWQAVFPGVSIFAVEPEDGNMMQLHANVALGPSPGNVRVVQAFAAANGGIASIDRSRGEYAYRMAAAGEDAGPEVEKIPVAMLVARASGGDGVVDLLKCDVEGTEAEIFATCRTWIGWVEAAVVETHPPYSPERLLADLTANGAVISRHLVILKAGGLALVWVRFARTSGQSVSQ